VLNTEVGYIHKHNTACQAHMWCSGLVAGTAQPKLEHAIPTSQSPACVLMQWKRRHKLHFSENARKHDHRVWSCRRSYGHVRVVKAFLQRSGSRQLAVMPVLCSAIAGRRSLHSVFVDTHPFFATSTTYCRPSYQLTQALQKWRPLVTSVQRGSSVLDRETLSC